jgi:hypothetical protein
MEDKPPAEPEPQKPEEKPKTITLEELLKFPPGSIIKIGPASPRDATDRGIFE